MIYTSSLLRWLQRKRYQYEVTFSLYMLTPTEKFIFSALRFYFHILWFTGTGSLPSRFAEAHSFSLSSTLFSFQLSISSLFDFSSLKLLPPS